MQISITISIRISTTISMTIFCTVDPPPLYVWTKSTTSHSWDGMCRSQEVSLHRSPQMMATDRAHDLQAHQGWDRSTPMRMAHEPSSIYIATTRPSPTSHRASWTRPDQTTQQGIQACEECNPFRSAVVCLSCRWLWSYSGPLMHAVVDRMRFRRRIKQTELILALVFYENFEKHRLTIHMRYLNCKWIFKFSDVCV